MEACGKRVAFSKARWARSVRPRRRQRPQGPGSVPRATHPASTLRQWLWQNNPPVAEANSGMQLKTSPESDSETSRIRVWADTTARGGRPQAGGRNLPAPAQPPALLGVRAPRPPVRHAARAVVRVRAALGPPRLLPVSDAPGRLRAVRPCARRAGAVGGGETPADDHLRVVLGAVGEAPELAGGWRRPFGHIDVSKSPCTTRWVTCRSQKSPTDSAEEPKEQTANRTQTTGECPVG